MKIPSHSLSFPHAITVHLIFFPCGLCNSPAKLEKINSLFLLKIFPPPKIKIPSWVSVQTPMAPRNPLAFLLISTLLFLSLSSSLSSAPPVSNVSFNFTSLSLRNLTLLGDSYLRNGVLGLTRELGVPSSSAGSALFASPVPFFDPKSNATASFSTKFSFSISNINPSSFGDGLSFFLSPIPTALGSPGGFLALVNSSLLTEYRFVAVEFDTRLDPHFGDPNGNHVGLDIDSLVSLKTADPISLGIDLKSGNPITAWIDYRSDRANLEVFLSYNASERPQKPLLSFDIDLSGVLREFMYVGFSASTEGSTELHLIESWTFETFWYRPPRQPHNVSDSAVVQPMRPQPISIPSDSRRRRRKLGLALGIAGPAFFGIVLLVFGFMSLRKWRTAKVEKGFKAELPTNPREFTYKELKEATRGFHSSRAIGHGAFGTVYKAFFLSSGTVSAVKRSKHSHEGKTEFLAELSIIACLRHKNLVQLHGWCTEKGELLLVYEFMPNGSLDRVLYQESGRGTVLKWSHRYNIAVGLASVLTYLHQECEQQVIHRDIKTSNIMLDGNFNARLGDFGLARLMDHDKSPVSTLTAGTMGYLAPEYLQYGKATEKTDVFSYGVVILEVACGRRPIEKDQNNQKIVNLVDWVWGLHSEGRILEAADKRLNGEFKEEDMKKLLLVGLSCANPDCMERPSMRRVFQILNDEHESIRIPKMKPSLSFSSSLPLSLEDIFADGEEGNKSPDVLNEIEVE